VANSDVWAVFASRRQFSACFLHSLGSLAMEASSQAP
jgi:hypothetical protein